MSGGLVFALGLWYVNFFFTRLDLDFYLVAILLQKRFLEKKLGSVVGEGVAGPVLLLPGDINSLKDRLRLLYAERSAGNVRATTT